MWLSYRIVFLTISWPPIKAAQSKPQYSQYTPSCRLLRDIHWNTNCSVSYPSLSHYHSPYIADRSYLQVLSAVANLQCVTVSPNRLKIHALYLSLHFLNLFSQKQIIIPPIFYSSTQTLASWRVSPFCLPFLSSVYYSTLYTLTTSSRHHTFKFSIAAPPIRNIRSSQFLHLRSRTLPSFFDVLSCQLEWRVRINHFHYNFLLA